MAQIPATAKRKGVLKNSGGRNNLLFGIHLSMLGAFVGLVSYLVALCHHLI
ncbi:MAG TPA: hypothetical protein VHA09_06160 [Nitrososphaera sp.]|nr:hypothetical protein [Nitrososphaera sp.]